MRPVFSLAALAVALTAAPAAAQDPSDPANITPVAGPGNAAAVDSSGSVTMTTEFEPQQIQPGEPFVWRSTTSTADPTSDCQTGDLEEIWPFSRVSAGGNFWTSRIDIYRPFTDIHTVDCNFGDLFTTTVTVPGSATVDMPLGCYQTVNWNSDIWFPGDQSNSGTISTLEVGDLPGSCAPTDCSDTIDNDEDQLSDERDPGCESEQDESELGTGECDDGLDNDGDGDSDFAVPVDVDGDGDLQAAGEDVGDDVGCYDAGDPVEGDDEDQDGDEVPDSADNCVHDFNPFGFGGGGPRQSDDDDQDDVGDVCDDKECAKLGIAATQPIDPCKLEPGDILLERGTGLKSAANRFLGDSFWTHAAMVIGYINLDRADPLPDETDCENVAVAGPNEADPDCELVIAEAVPGDPLGEVRLIDIKESVFGSPPPEVQYIKASRIRGLSSATRQQAADALKAHLLGPGGAGLPSNQYVTHWHAANFDYQVFDPTARGDNDFYCSSLVWWAYVNAGVDLDPDDGWFGLVDHLYITPQDLIEWNLGADDITGDVGVGGGSVASYSPAHVMVIDQQGRRAGMDGAGTLHEEIPGAIWRQTPESESVSAAGMNGLWQLVLSGYDSGPYTAVTQLFNGDASRRDAWFPGYTRPGQVEQLFIVDAERLTSRPAAADDVATTTAGTAVDIDVLANDRDLNGDILPSTLSITQAPANGSVSIAGERLRYAPGPGHTGADSLGYLVCDRVGDCSAATVRVTTTPASGGGGDSGGEYGQPGSPGGAESPAADTKAADTNAPEITALSITNAVFRVDLRGEAARRRAPLGTAFELSLSEPATVAIAIQRRETGRRVGRRCARRTARNRDRRPCVRWRSLATVARQGAAGGNRMPFSGRVRVRGRTRSLRPGSYRASFVARDAAGNSSAARTLGFRVAR